MWDSEICTAIYIFVDGILSSGTQMGLDEGPMDVPIKYMPNEFEGLTLQLNLVSEQLASKIHIFSPPNHFPKQIINQKI